MPAPDMNERAALYRLFDKKGRLLYAGISTDPDFRWKQHRGDKRWWPDVVDKQVTWYATRVLALRAEAVAIRDEAPIHNTVRPHVLADVPVQRVAPKEPSDFDQRLKAVAERRAEIQRQFAECDQELRALLVEGRGAGVSVAHMSRLTGFTRDWVAALAPAQKRQRDAGAARTIAES